MDREWFQSYIGKECVITYFNLGGSIRGTVTDLRDNWLEVMAKRGVQLVNADYVSAIRVLS